MSTVTDRATGGATGDALFTYGYLPVNTTFKICVSAGVQDPTQGPPEDKDAQFTTPGKETKGTSPTPPVLIEKALQTIATLLGGEFISLGGRTGPGWGVIDLR